MKNFVKEKYNQIYKSIGFERRGLFELLNKEFHSKTVLYPGCMIHVTPSFYFNHVVYVDNSELAQEFFAKSVQVSELINQYKVYKEKSYWSFLHKDFQSDLELKPASFDLLMSIFSGKLISYCQRYVKSQGLILTTSLFSDNETAIEDEGFKLISIIRCSNKKYSNDYSLKPAKLNKSRLKAANKGFTYNDNEEYYVYRKN